MDPHSTVIIGAGPAGLTAAYELSKLKRPILVLEEQKMEISKGLRLARARKNKRENFKTSVV